MSLKKLTNLPKSLYYSSYLRPCTEIVVNGGEDKQLLKVEFELRSNGVVARKSKELS
jgi:hypothetical protein